MTFAQTIRAYRESVGLTQAELAHKLTVSSQTVNNWETGRVEPWPRRKEALLDQLRVARRTGQSPDDARRVYYDDGVRGRNLGYQRKRQPNVCEEISGESSSDPGRQESMAKPQIDFRRPPPHG